MLPELKNKPATDKAIIQAVVRRFGPISRGKIHELTRIRRSATSELVRELIDEGRIVEAGRVSERAGRKKVLLKLNDEFEFVAAVDFDEDNITAGITDLRASVRHTVRERTDLKGGVEGLVKQLLACVHKTLKQAKIPGSSLIGIGVADPGLVDSRRGITVMSSTIDFWKQVPLKERFEREFGVPTVVESRSRAKTIAERALVAGEMAENMIYIDYGAGIGAGIVLDGRLLYGQSCAAGEFGHTHTMADGPACNCGSFGCLEAVAGTRAVEARIRKAIGEGGHSQALAQTGGDPARLTAWNVLEGASAGDKICSNIVAEIGEYLGLGLANLVNLFNPSVIVLDKRLGLAGPSLLDQIAQVIRRQALTFSSQNMSLRFGAIGPEGGVPGAALMVIEQHFALPQREVSI